jgi:hypothetical protein
MCGILINAKKRYLVGKGLKKLKRVDEARHAFANANELGVPVGGQLGTSMIKTAMDSANDGMEVGEVDAVNPYAE